MSSSQNMFLHFYNASLQSLLTNRETQWNTGLAVFNIAAILFINVNLLRTYYRLLDWKLSFSYVRLSQATLEIFVSIVLIPAMFTLNDEVVSNMGVQEPCFGSMQMLLFWMPHYILQVLNAYVIVYWKTVFANGTHLFEIVAMSLGCLFVLFEFLNSSWGFTIACVEVHPKPDLYYYLVYTLENPPVFFLIMAMAHCYYVSVKVPKGHFSPTMRKIWRKMRLMIRFQLGYDTILFFFWLFNNVGHVLRKAEIVDFYTDYSRATTNFYLVLAPIVRSGFAFWYAWINDRSKNSISVTNSLVDGHGNSNVVTIIN